MQKNHYSVNYINQPSAKFICPMNLFHLSRFCLNIISHCIQFCYPSIVIANNSLIWLALGNKTSKVARFQEITLKQKKQKTSFEREKMVSPQSFVFFVFLFVFFLVSLERVCGFLVLGLQKPKNKTLR